MTITWLSGAWLVLAVSVLEGISLRGNHVRFPIETASAYNCLSQSLLSGSASCVGGLVPELVVSVSPSLSVLQRLSEGNATAFVASRCVGWNRQRNIAVNSINTFIDTVSRVRPVLDIGYLTLGSRV